MKEKEPLTGTEKDPLIAAIISVEWQMFDKVQNEGGRAACQNDARTFAIMRYSQFAPLPQDVLESYRDDLAQAAQVGRNLLAEKYAYMMEYTDPTTFDRTLRDHLPTVSAYKQALCARIANRLIRDEQQFAVRYPALHAQGRPTEGAQADDVSVHVYALGELKTYSERTLERYDAWLRANPEENISVSVHRVMVQLYGYDSLEAAEARQKGARL